MIVETFDPIEILEMIQQEQATYLMLLPPSTFIRLLEAPNIKDYNLTSGRRLLSAAGAFPPAVMLKLHDLFPNTVTSCAWGQTELGPTGTTMVISREMLENNDERIKSIGLAIKL